MCSVPSSAENEADLCVLQGEYGKFGVQGVAVPPDFCTVFAAQHPAGAWKKEGRKRGNVPKTSDFLYPNLRTFEAKPRMFASKKSDVSPFPEGKCLKNMGKSP